MTSAFLVSNIVLEKPSYFWTDIEKCCLISLTVELIKMFG